MGANWAALLRNGIQPYQVMSTDLEQYLPLDGSQAMRGDLNMGGADIRAVSDIYFESPASDSPSGSSWTAPGYGITAGIRWSVPISGANVRGKFEVKTPIGSGTKETRLIGYSENTDASDAASVVLQAVGDTVAPLLDLQSASDPWKLIWDSDTDTFITPSSGLDSLSVWAGGVEMLRLTEAASDQVAVGNFGSTTVPSLTRIDDPNSGLSLRGSDAGGIIMGGTEIQTFASTGTTHTNFVSLAFSSLTIASGAITVTKSFHLVDTEGGAATDDLVTINDAAPIGTILVLNSANSARDVTLKDGTGNLLLAGDFTLATTAQTIMLLKLGGAQWTELSRSAN